MDKALWLVVVLAVVLAVYRVWGWMRYRRSQTSVMGDNTLPRTRPLINGFTAKHLRTFWRSGDHWRRLLFFAELILLGVWAVWIGRGYLLDFDKTTWPMGREFGVQVYSHHFWLNLLECGACALWNGAINGGAPALADPFGSVFHPVVMFTTLLFGVVNGVKITITLSIWLAGIAQWWIARLLDTGRLARLWSALLVMVGGHLLGRLELGAFGLTLAMASFSLMLAAAMWLEKQGGRRHAVLLGMCFTLVLLSGHGYLQLGLLALVPAFVLLLLDDQWKLRPLWRDYLLAAAVGLLLVGFFLIPLLHFVPNLDKFTDPQFGAAQPLAYIPLNLVISDWGFYNNDTLAKYPFPYLYNLYIGWWPVLLFLLSLYFLPRARNRLLLFSLTSVPFVFFFSSAIPYRWFVTWLPSLAGVRHVPLIAGLAIPLILGAAAYTLDCLWRLNWPELRIDFHRAGTVGSFSLRWLLLLPAVFSLRAAYEFNTSFTDTDNVSDVYADVRQIQLNDLQWVEPPFGKHSWVEPALDANLKLTNVVMPWWWKGRQNPPPYLMAREDGNQVGRQLAYTLGGIPVFEDPTQPYAFVQTDGRKIPCQAQGRGGYIQVTCRADTKGTLVVREHMWSGWKAWMDDQRVTLIGERWLEVDAPAGEHTFQFRYQPWDVLAGLAISFAGMVLVVWLWCSKPVKENAPAKPTKPSAEDENSVQKFDLPRE